MSYLDNLENNLKSLESQDEKDPEKLKRDQERRDASREAALRRAPHAEALRHSTFTSELMRECRTIGHQQRALVRFTWIGETLRLEAQTKRMDLIPTTEGVAAVFSEGGAETGRTAANPQTDDGAALARRWLTGQ